MPKLIVTATVRAAVYRCVPEWAVLNDTSREVQPGVWEIDVSQATYDRVMRIKRPGESVSDALMRAFDTLESSIRPKH